MVIASIRIHFDLILSMSDSIFDTWSYFNFILLKSVNDEIPKADYLFFFILFLFFILCKYNSQIKYFFHVSANWAVSIMLHCMVYCIALSCIVLYCVVLYSTKTEKSEAQVLRRMLILGKASREHTKSWQANKYSFQAKAVVWIRNSKSRLGLSCAETHRHQQEH